MSGHKRSCDYAKSYASCEGLRLDECCAILPTHISVIFPRSRVSLFPLETCMTLECKLCIFICTILTHIEQHVAEIQTDPPEKHIDIYTNQCMSLLCYTLTFSSLCFTVLSLRCVGRCVRFTCWQTRFLCVRLSGRRCLTPHASQVWRQVRGGQISTRALDSPSP